MADNSFENSNDGKASQLVDVRSLSKSYGSKQVLEDINLSIETGEIVGLIGPNGAGKSTLLKSLMGLVKCTGDIRVFGQNPSKNRSQLLEKMSYVADVASLPSWMRVRDLFQFVNDVHPTFDHAKALALLSDTDITLKQKVETLSKGMKTRLHLIIILSVESDFLILDEPTLGLDVLVRRDFQDRLVQDYFLQPKKQEEKQQENQYQHKERSVLITTHQIDEIESILTRVLFIKEGRITLDVKKSELQKRYNKLLTDKNIVFSEPNMQPIYQRSLPDKTELIFVDVDANKLKEYGEVVAPSLEDLFVATM